MKITEWLNNQENYGMCNPPMDAQTAINFLADYLEISDNVMSESVQQTNTYYVCEILSRYSKKYKKEIKNQQKTEQDNETEVTIVSEECKDFQYKKGYKKAIDDFADKIKKECWDRGIASIVNRIAEQLKS